MLEKKLGNEKFKGLEFETFVLGESRIDFIKDLFRANQFKAAYKLLSNNRDLFLALLNENIDFFIKELHSKRAPQVYSLLSNINNFEFLNSNGKSFLNALERIAIDQSMATNYRRAALAILNKNENIPNIIKDDFVKGLERNLLNGGVRLQVETLKYLSKNLVLWTDSLFGITLKLTTVSKYEINILAVKALSSISRMSVRSTLGSNLMQRVVDKLEEHTLGKGSKLKDEAISAIHKLAKVGFEEAKIAEKKLPKDRYMNYDLFFFVE